MKYIVSILLIVGLITSKANAVGPFEVSSSKDSTTLRFQFAGQFLTAYEDKDKGSGIDWQTSFYSKTRRVRPSLTVTVPKWKTSFRLHLSTAPGSLELMDLYFNSEIKPGIKIRVGQYKIPFTRYRIQSFQRLTFVDWSLVTKYFGAERQIGLSLHNGYERPPKWAYEIGVFSGTNARSSHAVGLAAIYGETVSNPSDLNGSSIKTEYHPELVWHFSYNSRDIDVRSDSDNKGGDWRYSFGSSIAWDLDPVKYTDLALRLAQEVLIKYRYFSFMIAGYLGFAGMDDAPRSRLAMTGILAQSAYHLTNRVEVSARFSRVDFDEAIVDDAFYRADSIIGLTEKADDVSQYLDVGNLLSETEFTLGLNIYIDEHNLKVQNDFGLLLHERRYESRTDYLIRSQLQISF